MVFDFEGNIIQNNIVELNKAKVVAKATTHSSYYHQRYNDDDEYYSNLATNNSNFSTTSNDITKFGDSYYSKSKFYQWDIVLGKYVFIQSNIDNGANVYVAEGNYREKTTSTIENTNPLLTPPIVTTTTKVVKKRGKATTIAEKIRQFNNLYTSCEGGKMKPKKRANKAKIACSLYNEINDEDYRA